MVQHVSAPWQAARTTHHRDAFPHAGCALAWTGRRFQVEINVRRNKQIELPVPIVIEKSAAGAPCSIPGNARLVADVRKSSVPVVAIQDIFSVIRHKKIFVSVVVVISHANSLPPTRVSESSLLRHVSKRSVVIVAVKVVCRRFFPRQRIERGSVHYKYVGPSVVVVVENRHSGSGRLDDEFLCVNAAKRVWRVQASFLRFINEVGDVLSLRFRRMLLALRVCVRETSVRTKKHAGSKMPAFR